MPHMYRDLPNTRLLIIQRAAKHFVEDGYTKSSINNLAKELDLSLGNITFYFPTKDHLLAVLAKELINFQSITMQRETSEGKTSLLAYCLELTAIAAACDESEVARDFYAAFYASPLTLELIRKSDTEKTKAVFAEYNPEWTEVDWKATENIVSGIEYATIMTKEEEVPLDLQIEKTLNSIMFLYGVPENVRKAKIEKVLAMDYRALGRSILTEFKEYITKVNAENVKNSLKRRKVKKNSISYINECDGGLE